MVLLLCLVGAGYWGWRFFPVYFDGWTVDSILRNSAAAIYKQNNVAEPQRSNLIRDIVEKTRDTIIGTVGISDPELRVNLEINGDTATLTADYDVPVTHPYIHRITTVHMHRAEEMDIKPVKWE